MAQNQQFKVGDEVVITDYCTKYSVTTPGSHGIISKIPNKYECTITFKYLSSNKVTPPEVYTIQNLYLKLYNPGPPLTKEESLNLKCKTLWNKSSFVKSNPQQAY